MPTTRRLAASLLAAGLLAGCQSSRSEPDASRSTTTTSTTTTTVAERIVFVYQEGGIDALAASALSRRGVVVPVPQCGEVSQETLDAIRRLSPTSVRRVGGPDAVCDDVMRQLEALIAKR